MLHITKPWKIISHAIPTRLKHTFNYPSRRDDPNKKFQIQLTKANNLKCHYLCLLDVNGFLFEYFPALGCAAPSAVEMRYISSLLLTVFPPPHLFTILVEKFNPRSTLARDHFVTREP